MACKGGLLLRRAVHHQQIGVAGGEQARANADRGAGKKRVGGRLHGVGQLHTAMRVVLGGAQHARGGVSLRRILRGLRQDDAFAVKLRLLHIHQPVEGRVFFPCDALAGVKHRVKGLA